MKLSNYNVLLELENEDNLIYNTLKRSYLVYKKHEKDKINYLMDNINRTYFEVDEAEYIKKFIDKGMIVNDDLNELDRIQYLINKKKFENKTLILVIQPTLDCNFRCIYCYEEHKESRISDETATNILKYIENNTAQYDKLIVGWFGGEPLLEIKKIYQLTSRIKEICSKNNVKFNSNMTTNGYLFNDDIINRLEELSLNKIQITVDGSEEYHDKMRPLANGQGTYKKIISNIIKLASKDVIINLRININKDNYQHIEDLFDEIPNEYRNKITVYVMNLFTEKNKIDAFEIYKTAIQKGYRFNNTSNSFSHCEVCGSSNITIEPTGKVVPCSVASEQGYSYGHINESGNLVLTNQNLFYKIKNLTALKNDKCNKCNQLPICVGGCSLARYKNNCYCTKNDYDCLTLEEKIKLHYYNDLKHNFVKYEGLL